MQGTLTAAFVFSEQVRVYDLYAGGEGLPAIAVRLQVREKPPAVLVESELTGSFIAEAQDLVGCLMQVRTRLERDGYLLACQGALPAVWATGQLRASKSGYAQLFNQRDPSDEPLLVDVFLPAPLDRVVSIKAQRARHTG